MFRKRNEDVAKVDGGDEDRDRKKTPEQELEQELKSAYYSYDMYVDYLNRALNETPTKWPSPNKFLIQELEKIQTADKRCGESHRQRYFPQSRVRKTV